MNLQHFQASQVKVIHFFFSPLLPSRNGSHRVDQYKIVGITGAAGYRLENLIQRATTTIISNNNGIMIKKKNKKQSTTVQVSHVWLARVLKKKNKKEKRNGRNRFRSTG